MNLSVEKYVRLMAGSFVIISVVLALTLSKWWLIWTVLVGLNLIQSVFTHWCPAETILKKLGIIKE